MEIGITIKADQMKVTHLSFQCRGPHPSSVFQQHTPAGTFESLPTKTEPGWQRGDTVPFSNERSNELRKMR